MHEHIFVLFVTVERTVPELGTPKAWFECSCGETLESYEGLAIINAAQPSGAGEQKGVSMSELEIAKDKFYNFLVGAAGLRFKSRKDFDDVVDAIVKAAQPKMHLPSGGLCAICGRPEYSHSPKGHDFRSEITPSL
jgi:hypothetical protein